jgi:hypothetical protein
MNRHHLTYLFVNIVGGVGVLGSYAHGLLTHPGQGADLWGTLPAALVPLYAGVMPFAAAGYLVTMALVLLTPPDALRLRGRPALPRFTLSTAVFLVASSSWMPLCWQALDTADTALLWPIQLVLLVAGGTALLNLGMLTQLAPTARPLLQKAAVAGSAALFVQCAVLDALVWPRFFNV